MEYIIPAIVILVGNLFSAPPGSRRWEVVTAAFGWTAGITLCLWLVVGVFASQSWAAKYLVQVWAFCLLQALTRDWEVFSQWALRKLTRGAK